MAICNKAPVDGASAATDVTGDLTGADSPATKISYMFPKAGFTCLKTPTPPGPTPAPPLPVTGVGMACSNAADDCGSDKTLCCGVATKGVADGADPTKPVSLPNAAICNKAPVDGTAMAEDFTGTLEGNGADKTQIKFTYAKADF